jgi:hypothetical protein
MNKLSQSHEFICTLLIFTVLIQLPGCSSYKVISSSELPTSGEYCYFLNTGNSIYRLENPKISNKILSGRIVEHSCKGNKIKIYILSDSVVTINDESILSVPTDKIVKINKEEYNGLVTGFFVLGCLVALVPVIMLIDLAINGLDIDIGP